MAGEFEDVVDFVEGGHFAEVGVPLDLVFGSFLSDKQLAEADFLHHVDDADLVSFYLEASAFHYCSEEGFPAGRGGDLCLRESEMLELAA